MLSFKTKCETAFTFAHIRPNYDYLTLIIRNAAKNATNENMIKSALWSGDTTEEIKEEYAQDSAEILAMIQMITGIEV